MRTCSLLFYGSLKYYIIGTYKYVELECIQHEYLNACRRVLRVPSRSVYAVHHSVHAVLYNQNFCGSAGGRDDCKSSLRLICANVRRSFGMRLVIDGMKVCISCCICNYSRHVLRAVLVQVVEYYEWYMSIHAFIYQHFAELNMSTLEYMYNGYYVLKVQKKTQHACNPQTHTSLDVHMVHSHRLCCGRNGPLSRRLKPMTTETVCVWRQLLPATNTR